MNALSYRKAFSFEDQTVVVTGGAGLLGSEICRGFCDMGANVVVADIDVAKARTLAQSLECASFRYLDVTDQDSVRTLVNDLDQVDVWVNAAYPRTQDWANRFENISLESWRQNVDMQMNSCFYCCQAIAQKMIARRKGCIINIGSIYGLVGPHFDIYDGTSMTMPAAYSAIKGGIVSLTRYLATYLASDGVRVNAVCPGGVFDRQPSDFVRAYERQTPLGRMAEPRDIVGAVVFLSCDAARYITGQVLAVDGGWTAW